MPYLEPRDLFIKQFLKLRADEYRSMRALADYEYLNRMNPQWRLDAEVAFDRDHQRPFTHTDLALRTSSVPVITSGE